MVKKYHDPRTKFIAKMIKAIQYLDQIPDPILYELIFSLKIERYEKDDYLLLDGQFISKMFFVEQGYLEVFTQFEGNKFILDVLGPGSVINYRSIFLKD